MSVAEASSRTGAVALGLLRATRPKQWVKNVLVFAAPAAAGLLDNPTELLHAIQAFVAFCFASGATYLLNDAADVEADRSHPEKRYRPIATGVVSIGLARVVAVVLIALAFATMALTDQPLAVAYVGIYLVVTTAYSSGLKRVAAIDLVLVAAGFVIRALAGAKAVDVDVSDWFLIVTTFGSLFVVAGKRYAELRALGAGAKTRSTLELYSIDYLRMAVGLGLSGTAISYCLFALERAEFETAALPAFELSIVPVLTGLLRYALVLETGRGGAPEEVFLSDRWLQACGAGWAFLFAYGVYAG